MFHFPLLLYLYDSLGRSVRTRLFMLINTRNGGLRATPTPPPPPPHRDCVSTLFVSLLSVYYDEETWPKLSSSSGKKCCPCPWESNSGRPRNRRVLDWTIEATYWSCSRGRTCRKNPSGGKNSRTNGTDPQKNDRQSQEGQSYVNLASRNVDGSVPQSSNL